MDLARIFRECVCISYKPLLFSLAYRMLGSVMDAEDVVQEAFLYVNETNQDACPQS